MTAHFITLVHDIISPAMAQGPGYVWPLLFVLAFAFTVLIRIYAADPFGFVPFIAFAALVFSGIAGFIWFYHPIVMTLHNPFMASVAAIQALMIPAGVLVIYVDQRLNRG